jgi:hypothetical protein
MKQYYMRKAIFSLILVLVFSIQIVYTQEFYEVNVNDSENYTNISDKLGRDIKFLASDDKLIVLDYENFRILFYKKGTHFEDNQFLKIIGKHSCVQEDQSFDPVLYNRLSKEFTGIIFNDILWITNYTFGEIVRFDLDGNYLNTIPGQYRILDTNDSTLYAFNVRSIYRFDPALNDFVYINELHDPGTVDSDVSNTNVKIGFNRIGIRKDDNLKVYNFSDYLKSGPVTPLFSITSGYMRDFEIMPDKILWATNQSGAYKYCDLNGSAPDSGDFDLYLYSYHFSENILYVVGSWDLKMFNSTFTELAHVKRNTFYLYLNFFGADSTNLYFYDQKNGGFVVTPINKNEGVFNYDPDNEIYCKGLSIEFRISENYKYLLIDSPPDSMIIHQFDTENMTGFDFHLEKIQHFDVVGDSIFTISGKNLNIYLNDGTFLSSFSLSNLSGSNLSDIDSSSSILFAANDNNIFIGYENKLNVLNHSGMFEKVFDIIMNKSGQLFCSNSHVFCNSPPNSLDIPTGNIISYIDYLTSYRGFFYENFYWYDAGVNKFACIDLTTVGVENVDFNLPVDFKVYQNFPNPFNPQTTIRFSIPKSSHVKIHVYDLNGRLHETLVDCVLNSGNHAVVFDGKEYASGLYFCEVCALGVREMRKMVLLK